MTSIAMKQGGKWWAVLDLNQRPKDYESRGVFKVINDLRANLFRNVRHAAPLKASNGAGRLAVAEHAQAVQS